MQLVYFGVVVIPIHDLHKRVVASFVHAFRIIFIDGQYRPNYILVHTSGKIHDKTKSRYDIIDIIFVKER